MPRTDRRPDQLRPLSFARGYTGSHNASSECGIFVLIVLRAVSA